MRFFRDLGPKASKFEYNAYADRINRFFYDYLSTPHLLKVVILLNYWMAGQN